MELSKASSFSNFKILTFSTIIWNNIRKSFGENAGWESAVWESWVEFQFQKFPTQES